MLCQRCKQKEATIHITECEVSSPKDPRCEDSPVRKVDLCEPCCRETRPWFLEKDEGFMLDPPPGTRGPRGQDPK
jgi:hypothetical protein